MSQSIEETFFQKLLRGESYIVSEEKTVASGGTFNIHVENPSDSGSRVVIYNVSVRSKGAASVHVHDNFDSITPGTQVEVHSSEAESSGTSVSPVNAYQDSSKTETNTHGHGVLGAGGGGANSLGGELRTANSVLGEGTDFVVHATNDSADSEDMTITIVFFTVRT